MGLFSSNIWTITVLYVNVGNMTAAIWLNIFVDFLVVFSESHSCLTNKQQTRLTVVSFYCTNNSQQHTRVIYIWRRPGHTTHTHTHTKQIPSKPACEYVCHLGL